MNADIYVYFALACWVIFFLIIVIFLRVSNTHVICRSSFEDFYSSDIVLSYCWAIRWTRGWSTRTTTLSFLSRWTSHDSVLKSIRHEFSIARVDANGPCIEKSEKIRSKPSYKSIFRRAMQRPKYLYTSPRAWIFDKIICNYNCEVKFIILLR